MKIKLAILSLFCGTILLNGCAIQSIQPDAQSNLLLKPKLADCSGLMKVDTLIEDNISY